MSDLDNLLGSMGISLDDLAIQTAPAHHAAPQEPAEQPQEEPQQEVQEETTVLSDDDFNDILSDNGFVDTHFIDTEGNTSQSESISQTYNEMIESISESLRQAHDERMESIESGTEQISEDLPDWENNGQSPDVTEDEEEDDAEYDETEDLDEVAEESGEEVVGEVNNEPEKIPLNSPTLLMDDTTSRFSGAEWFEEIQKQRIILAGLGGIGSWTALQLSRMAPEALFMYDDDRVETANMSGQIYGFADIGKYKVNAMAHILNERATAHNLYALNEKFTSFTPAGDIMICGFDNMMARRTFFNSWFTHVRKESTDKSKCLYIDGRLSLDTLQILCIQGTDEYNINRYRNEFLFSDEEADPTVCSMKQTTYLASMIGSLIVNLFTNFVANRLDPVIPYDLPFFTEYDSQNMIFKTEQ